MHDGIIVAAACPGLDNTACFAIVGDWKFE